MLTTIQAAKAQDISFFHLTKKEGLNDNQVTAATLDQNGLLWIGTAKGLNCYDGYHVKQFYKEDYPALENKSILRMSCDDENRLWIHFANKQIAMVDENRRFHAIHISDSGHSVSVDYLLPNTSRGILFLSGSMLYTPDEGNPLQITRVPWQGDKALNHVFRRINTWDKDKIVFSGQNRLCLFDVNRLNLTDTLTIPGIVAAVKLNEAEALITTSDDNKLCRVNLTQGRIVQVYGNLKDQYGEVMHAYPRSIYHLKNHQFILTSAYAGVYVFDAEKETLIRYKHDPVNPQTISADNTNFIFADTSGYFFITSNSSGLNYFNIKHYLAKNQTSFRDENTGDIFDGYVNCINSDKDGHIWLGTQNALIEWNRQNNQNYFHQYGKIDGKILKGTEEVRALCFDKDNRLWVGLNRFGVVVMNGNKEVIEYLNTYGKDQYLLSNMIYDIKEAPDDNIWIATAKGLNIVDGRSFRVLRPDLNPVTQALCNIPCNVIFFPNDTEAWVGTGKGAYKIDLATKRLVHYDKKLSENNDNVLGITNDQKGNFFVGTDAGMYSIKDGEVTATFNRPDRFHSNAFGGFLKDNTGRIWISNNNALLCYEPVSREFEVYSKGTGLSDAGFRPFACFKNQEGELFWGSEKGVSYFDPARLLQQQLPLNVYIHTVTTMDSTYWLAQSCHPKVPFLNNSIGFAFSAIDLLGSKNIVFKYILEGVDAAWKTTETLDEVYYSQLPPGNYTFRVMATRDGRHWVDAKNDISFIILSPWWHSVWFYGICLLVLTGIVYVFFSQKKTINEEKEIQKAIDYFATSSYERESVDNILWDISHNCISCLKLEDCVIYLLDNERQVLLQKAAYGPKSPRDFEISNPIEIPLGKGIVGNAAQSGKPELVKDTRKDKRYIIDDEARLSELAVPIIHNETVIGVIDSEHSKKHFFKQKHLDALQSIASLCSAKISRAIAVEAMKKSKEELLELHHKMTESKFMNLRLQMNPHFLFNTLNSIQHLVVSGQSLQAYKYLNIFSNLMRSSLQNAMELLIPMEEELRMLHLYLDLESLRFRKSFSYQILMDHELEQEELQIPPMMIQPFAENAIWHGLLHKDGDKRLRIEFTACEDFLKCVIEDNGIGRKQADAVQRTQLMASNRESKGIRIVAERLALMEQKTGKQSSLKITDLYHNDGQPSGTRVVIHIPYYNPLET